MESLPFFPPMLKLVYPFCRRFRNSPVCVNTTVCLYSSFLFYKSNFIHMYAFTKIFFIQHYAILFLREISVDVT